MLTVFFLFLTTIWAGNSNKVALVFGANPRFKPSSILAKTVVSKLSIGSFHRFKKNIVGMFYTPKSAEFLY